MKKVSTQSFVKKATRLKIVLQVEPRKEKKVHTLKGLCVDTRRNGGIYALSCSTYVRDSLGNGDALYIVISVISKAHKAIAVTRPAYLQSGISITIVS